MSVVGDVASGVSNILGGRAQASALKTEGVMLEREAKAEEVRGKQISAARKSQLVDALSALEVGRAAGGISIDSPSLIALRKRQIDTFEAAENAEVLSSLQRRDGLKAKAAAKRRAAPYAALAGYAAGVKDFGSAVDRMSGKK